jgi:hypothetical protein
MVREMIGFLSIELGAYGIGNNKENSYPVAWLPVCLHACFSKPHMIVAFWEQRF